MMRVTISYPNLANFFLTPSADIPSIASKCNIQKDKYYKIECFEYNFECQTNKAENNLLKIGVRS